MREEGDSWYLEKVLVTLQHREDIGLMDLAGKVFATLSGRYAQLQSDDSRWRMQWKEVTLTVNPNGPYIRGGSDGDNGQTGRKLVMDYYGPRVPIGGGALSGKHPAHVDRLAAYAARQAAVKAVKTGARECLLRVAYAPNRNEPLEVIWEMEGRGDRQPREYFCFDAMLSSLEILGMTDELGNGSHFWDLNLCWNN